jgi:hypothetical protein
VAFNQMLTFLPITNLTASSSDTGSTKRILPSLRLYNLESVVLSTMSR